MDDYRSETPGDQQQQEQPRYFELHQVGRRDARMLKFKLSPRIPTQDLTRVFDDDRSVALGKASPVRLY